MNFFFVHWTRSFQNKNRLVKHVKRSLKVKLFFVSYYKVVQNYIYNHVPRLSLGLINNSYHLLIYLFRHVFIPTCNYAYPFSSTRGTSFYFLNFDTGSIAVNCPKIQIEGPERCLLLHLPGPFIKKFFVID